MEPYLIYKAAYRLHSKVKWDEGDNYGWMYCGLSNDLNRELLWKEISNFITTNTVYFVVNRKQSFEQNILNVVLAIAKHIDHEDFSIWSNDFKLVIDFKNIGVFRKGCLQQQSGA